MTGRRNASFGVTMLHRSDFWFFFPLRVRYAEADQQGVVFNAHYLTYFDVAITEYMRALNYDYRLQPECTGTDFHVIKALVEYRAPIQFDDEIDIGVRTGRIGRTSLSFQLAIFGKDSEQLRTCGEIVWVNAHQATRKAAPVPSELETLIRMREINQ
jgi:acyl-CoA thioester hydrolase